MRQVQYLFDYLRKEWSPKTIVVEDNYVDGDYLGDYTNFYATAYARFDRFCKRIHFFIAGFDYAQFERYLLREAEDGEQEDFESSYLGFTVIRPLPQAIIGRTLLRTYAAFPVEGAPRYYQAVEDYYANLFGLKLKIAQSLPFQQQDSVVAACATVALWSAFHKAAHLFGTPAPRPAEITRNATANVFQERIFPSSGLTLEQICDAIRANDLEPELFRFDNHLDVPLLSWLRAYLDYGIPLIVGIKIPQGALADTTPESKPAAAGDAAKDQGTALDRDAPQIVQQTHKSEEIVVQRHAITVVGYRAANEAVREREMKLGYEAPSFGRRITELYCHDDNLGAFAAYDIITDSDGNLRLRCLDYGEDVIIEIDNVIAPVYDKIRLPFPEMQKWVTLIDIALRGLLEDKAYAKREWDVRLMSNENFKNEMRQITASREERLALVTASEPRFLWSAVLMSGRSEVVRIHADATSIARSVPIRHIRFGSEELHKNIAAVLEWSAEVEAKRLRRFLLESLGNHENREK